MQPPNTSPQIFMATPLRDVSLEKRSFTFSWAIQFKGLATLQTNKDPLKYQTEETKFF